MLEGGKRPATIETLPLAMERFSGIKLELSGWATAEISFEFDPKGTHLFSILELAYGYAKRCDDLTRSIESLIAAGHIVPATIVGRALIETVAMGSFFVSEMDRLITYGKLENLNQRLTSFWGGSKQTGIKPVHVNDALRHFEEVDAKYVRYLDEKYRVFTSMYEALRKKGVEPPPIEQALSAMKNYDFLSDISHPNGVGVQFIYPYVADMDEKIKATANALLDRYRFQARMAIFQCHHLNSALETTRTLPDRYRETFIKEK